MAGEGAGGPEGLTVAEREVLDHAWRWFALHSGQRMQLLGFYLVALSLVLAAYGTALQRGAGVLAAVLAAAGAVVSLAFALVDLRTRQLVKAAELPMARLEERLAERSGVAGIRLLETVERATWGASYRRVILRLMLSVGLLMAGGAVYALVVAT